MQRSSGPIQGVTRCRVFLPLLVQGIAVKIKNISHAGLVRYVEKCCLPSDLTQGGKIFDWIRIP